MLYSQPYLVSRQMSGNTVKFAIGIRRAVSICRRSELINGLLTCTDKSIMYFCLSDRH